MPKKSVRIAFLSDLHAYQPDPAAVRAGPSYLPANPGVADPDPFRDLEALVDREGLTVDLVLCGGDICDKADLRGFQYAWRKLNELKSRVSAHDLVATCGNHDLNSRLIMAEEDPDPKGGLQTIEPDFPFRDLNLTNHFWARNFALVQPIEGVRVLVLNTSAYHGGAQDESDHGRVSQRTISAIEKALKSATETVGINILLCHHHVKPLQGLWTKAADGEYMRKGVELVNMLSDSTMTPWLVLHGHRHIPNLEFSASPSFVIVGASSFSGQVQGRFNQFHILDIEADETAPQPLRGTIDTWTWDRSSGWARRPIGNEDEGFPPVCGFGSCFQPRALAQQVEGVIGSAPAYVSWDDLVVKIPELRYMTPLQSRHVEDLLHSSSINFARDREGMISQVGRAQ